MIDMCEEVKVVCWLVLVRFYLREDCEDKINLSIIQEISTLMSLPMSKSHKSRSDADLCTRPTLTYVLY